MSTKPTKPAPQGGSTPRTGAGTRREQLRAQQEAQARQQRTMRIILVGAIVAALAIIAVVVVVVVNNQQAGKVSAAAQVDPPNITADRTAINVPLGTPKADAPTVRVYQDYQCPACKTVGSLVNKPLEELVKRGDIKLEYSTMTFLDASLRNTSSLQAALAASCADTVGKYVQMHDAIYAGQPVNEGDGYTAAQLSTTFPAAAGITGDDLTKYTACFTGKQTQKAVKDIDDAASDAKITSTPTYQVNGKKWDMQSTLGQDLSADTLLAVVKQVAGS